MPRIWNEYFGGLGAQLTRDLITGPFVGVARDAITQLGQGITQSHELDVMYVLIQLEPSAFQAIWNEYRQALANGRDDEYAANLASLLKREKNGEVNVEQTKAFLTEFAKMDSAQRYEFIQFVQKNSLLQRLRKHMAQGVTLLEAMARSLAESTGETARELNDWARKKNEALQPLRSRLQEEADMPEFWKRWYYAIRYMRKDGWREAMRVQKEEERELNKKRQRAN